jgi:hypothetical protein
MKVGDLITLSSGPRIHFSLTSESATLIKKIPRGDDLEYDWLVLVDGRLIELGRQIENSAEVLNESR